MRMEVIRLNGAVINIGPWEYFRHTEADGTEVADNPLPEGATSAEEEVEVMPDGSRRAVEA